MASHPLRSLFLDHPASVDETYTEHARVAGHFARELAMAAMAAAVHAVFPGLCCTSASTRVKRLHTEMTAGARAEAPQSALQSAPLLTTDVGTAA